MPLSADPHIVVLVEGRSDAAAVAALLSAHGLDGEVGIKTFDPASEALLEVERLALVDRSGTHRTFTVTGSRSTSKEIVLSLENVDDRNTAESLVGSAVFVFRGGAG